VIAPDANAGFVAAMEDVLETYQKPRDPDRPLVCLDETSKQLIVETRAPIRPRPANPPGTITKTQRRRQSVHNLRAAGGMAVGVLDAAPPRCLGFRKTKSEL
jgi:hypothetical protein